MKANVSATAEIIHRRPSLKKKWLYSGLGVVVVLGAGVATAAVLKAQSSGSAVSSATYHIAYGDVTQTISASGAIQPFTSVNLNFQGSGVLKTLNVKIGQNVQAGQVLATLDNTSVQSQVVQAQASVSSAEANLAAAQAKLVQAKEGVTPATIAIAKSAVTRAQATVTGAQQQYKDQLALFNDPTAQQQQLLSAQNAVAQAQATLQVAQQSAQQQLTVAEQNAQQADQNLQAAQQQYGTVTQEQVQAAYQAYQSELSFSSSWQKAGYAGTNPYTAVLNTDLTNYQNLNTAYSALQTAQQQDQTAKQALTQAQSPTSVATDQAQNQAAENNLKLAQSQYNDHTSAQQSLDNAANAVTQDEAALQSAQASLQQTMQPADPATVLAAVASVQVAQAGVQSAQAQLQSAQATAGQYVIKAPMSGQITQVNGVVGELVSNSSPVLVLTDANKADMELNIQVAESDIGSIKVGDPVSLATPSLSNQTFKGKVVQIYPTPTVVSNVTEYTVIASVDNTLGSLMSGMTASVTMETASASHVLTVPAISLVQVGSREGVYVVGTRPTGGNFNVGNPSNPSAGANTSSGSQSGQPRTGNGSGNASGGATRGNGAGFAGGANAPKGSYFQPVQVGLFGTRSVQIVQGLQAGETILLVPPGSSTTSGGTKAGGGGAGGAAFALGGRGF